MLVKEKSRVGWLLRKSNECSLNYKKIKFYRLKMQRRRRKKKVEIWGKRRKRNRRKSACWRTSQPANVQRL